LTLAVGRGNVEATNILLQFGADPDVCDREGNLALHLSVKRNCVGCCAELLSYGANTTLHGLSLDQLSSKSPCQSLVKEAKMGGDLMDAARLGEVEEALKIASLGPHVTNFRDQDKWSALHGACFSDSAQIVRILVQNGARLEARTVHGYTPLIEACATNKLHAAKALIGCGADLNAVDGDGWSSLHYAAAESVEEVVQLLLDHGARVDLCTNEGQLASELCQKNIAKNLIVAREREELELARRLNMETRIRTEGSALLDKKEKEEEAQEKIEEVMRKEERLSKLANRVSLAEGMLNESLRENDVLRDAVVHMAEEEKKSNSARNSLRQTAENTEFLKYVSITANVMACLEECGHHIRHMEDSSLNEAFIQYSSIEMSEPVEVLWKVKKKKGGFLGQKVSLLFIHCIFIDFFLFLLVASFRNLWRTVVGTIGGGEACEC
jgi:ankyrin repeat protein